MDVKGLIAATAATGDKLNEAEEVIAQLQQQLAAERADNEQLRNELAAAQQDDPADALLGAEGRR